MALLEIDNLSIGYHSRRGLVTAVDDVSFALQRGRSLGLVGESGCGKTTIGKALMGLLPPNAAVLEGSIRFDGIQLAGASEALLRSVRWDRIAMIFQAAMNALNPIHTVGAQVIEALHAHKPEMSRTEAAERVDELFRLVGIPEGRSKDYPHHYSGGMKQRAVIAMALACSPELIIADEPTTALDVIVQDQILKQIRALQDDLGISILFISHDISVVSDVCHDIGVMYAGQIIEYGSRKEVFERPAHPYTRALLGAFLSLMQDRGMAEGLPGAPPDLADVPAGCRFCDRCCVSGDNCRVEAPQWFHLSAKHHVLCCAEGIQAGRNRS
ncbi:MAG: ABC transporter ATP-binding protein [Pseudomonadota bacterium]